MGRSDFSKNVLTLISGTTVAQVISIGIAPILSRIYSIEEFAMFGTFSGIIGMVSLLIGARYEGAILLPKKESDAANLLVLSLVLNVLISLFFFLFVLLLSFFIANSNTDKELFNWFYFAPIFTMFTGFAQSMNNWYNRKRKYNKIVVYRITNSATNSISSLALGKIGVISNGLILSLLISVIVSTAVFFNGLKNDFLEFKKAISYHRIISLATEYKRFPLTNSFQSLSDAFQINGIIYFVYYYFGKIFTGVFSMAIRVLLVPMNFAGAAMAQVFYQQASDTFNEKGDLQGLIKSTISKSILITIPVFITLLFFGPQIFAFVLGEKWREAGDYARILSPWVLLDFVRAPLSQIPIIIGRQKRLLGISILSNAIVFFSMLYSGIVLKEMKMGLYMLSIFQTLFIIGIIVWIYKIASSNNYNKIESI
jgi:lipopolysaccharide exporter